MSKIMRALVAEAKAAREAERKAKEPSIKAPDCPYSGGKCQRKPVCDGICHDSYPYLQASP